MDSKKSILDILGKAQLDINKLISMVESGKDFFRVHTLINKAIRRIQVANKVMINAYLEECLDKFYKKNELGQKSRQEVINLFQN